MTYRKYEWTAFTEADLLGAGTDNGHSLGHGDKFTMPGSATVTMSTWDNDYTMSGDNYTNEMANDQYGQNAYADGHYLGAKLYAESYHVLYGSDGKTYYLIEIEVEGYNAPGVGDDFFAFYGSVPPAGVELSVGGQCNVTGCWVDYKCLSAGDTAPANTPPTFTNLPSDGIICIDENTTFVIDVNATDADQDALTYEIVGGRDASFFEIDAHTGDLKFIGAPDFENPISGGHSNTYDVTIKVSDGNGGHETKALWVKVKDVEENGVIKGRFTHDADGNDNEWNEDTHQWDEGIEGATIQLLDLHGNVVATSVTDHYGNYSFDVPAGDYQVKFPTVEGKIFSEQDSANAAEHFDSDADENGLTDVIHLPEGGVICDVDTGVKEKPVVGDCIVIEAEDMHEWGFQTAHGSNASGGEFIKLNCAGGEGDVWTTFNGESGEYDLKFFAQDESDGQSKIYVKVNGHLVDTITLDRDSDGYGSDHGNFSEFTIDNIQLNTGDTLSFWVDGSHGEFVRFDKIELCKDGEPCPDGFSLEDFSGPAKGTVVGTQFDGFSVVAQRAGDHPNSENDAMIFDSAHPTGGDHDLEYANLGNILIISEDNDSGDPDDNAHGGSITFTFDNPSDVHDIKLLDIEESGGTIDLFDADGNLIKTVAIPAAGDNSIQTIKLDAVGVDSMVINLVGSGAVDDLCFKPGDPPALGSLSGTYFFDADRDGLDNDGDNGVTGITVELLDENGDPTGITTTTDADGNYSFGGLVAGEYGVKFTDPDTGRELTTQDVDGNASDDIDSDAADVGGGMSAITGITVNAGQDTPNNDAGVVEKLGSLSGRYFCDDEDDGTELSSTGLDVGVAGFTVVLLDASGAPVLDAGGNQITTQTGSDGSYSFTGLIPGDYGVQFVGTPPFKDFIAPDQGDDDTVDSDAIADGSGNATIQGITVSAGEDTPDNDAGVVDLPGSLSGTYFFDADRDGLDNDGDNGVTGITVELLDENGDPTGITTTTDADGNYSFGGLVAGEYGVKFTDPDTGRELTTQDVDGNASDDIDSDAADVGGGMSAITGITVNAGQDTPNNDAGVVEKLGSLSGRYFCDDNRDGLDNDTDNAIEGVTVLLLDANGDPTGITTMTDGDGNYSFGNLSAGIYGVEFVDTVSGKLLTTANVGSDDTIDSDAVEVFDFLNPTRVVINAITVVAGEDTPDNDAGVFPNEDPIATDEEATFCADDGVTVDLSDNFSDSDSDSVEITMLEGINFFDGDVLTLDGIANEGEVDEFMFTGLEVTRTGDSLTFDAEAAFADLDINETATVSLDFKVQDSDGATATASIDLTIKGDANSVEGLALNLPDSATIQVVDENDPAGSSDEAYTIRISDGNESIDGIYAEAYCISAFDPFVADGFGDDVALAPAFGGADVYLGLASEVPAGVLETIGINGATAADNLDEITWILNQDFSNNGFTDAEVQGAIWALTDGESIENDFGFAGGIFVTPGSGDVADAQMIVDMALTTGSGFEAEDGDIVAVVVDPNETNFEQPFVFGVAYDDLDCIC